MYLREQKTAALAKEGHQLTDRKWQSLPPPPKKMQVHNEAIGIPDNPWPAFVASEIGIGAELYLGFAIRV